MESPNERGDTLPSSELPSISLVTPTLNQRELIAATIDSVLTQSYPGLEYVVIDGGSSDGTAELIKGYEDHLAYWVSEPDDGHYAAVNKGFARTSGEIMGYLNGDDTLLPGSLALVAKLFTEFPEMEWLSGAHVALDDAGRPVELWPPARWSRWHFLSPHVTRFLPQESTFWRRGLWDRAGASMDESFGLAADYELWARFSRYADLYSVRAPVGCFRFVEGQRSVALKERYMAEVRAIRDRERGTERRFSLALSGSLIWATQKLPIIRRLRNSVETLLGAPPLMTYTPDRATFSAQSRGKVPVGARRIFQRPR